MFAALMPAMNLMAASASSCSKSFLGLKTWFYYLPDSSFNGDCTIKSFNALGGHSSFLLIALAILDDLLIVSAFVTVGYIIYGGIQYVTSQGSPDATNKARQTIINALIGLVVAMLAASMVSFIGRRLG